jgi:cobalamin-dependent methionine synthase I
MSGLELAKQIVDPSAHAKLKEDMAARRLKLAQDVKERPKSTAPVVVTRSKTVQVLDQVPPVPGYERHVLSNTPLDHIWKFINPVMLYGRHLGLRTSARVLGTPAEAELSKTEEGRKALELKEAVEGIKTFLRGGVMQARAVFQFFKAGSDGNRVLLFYAELLHTQIRNMWGFPDKPDMTMLERFRAEYGGKRYSFGYPACPRLEDQSLLFSALRPEDIGVQLTDGCMMEPEASVSAVVFHHPQAHYFAVT